MALHVTTDFDLDDHLEAAEEHMLEGAFYWLVKHRFANSGEFLGDVGVWPLIEAHYPGGQAAFRHDPVRAAETGPVT